MRFFRLARRCARSGRRQHGGALGHQRREAGAAGARLEHAAQGFLERQRTALGQLAAGAAFGLVGDGEEVGVGGHEQEHNRNEENAIAELPMAFCFNPAGD